MNGVLVVDKPKGPTSHDVVARARKVLGTREVGHAGTLDPMATGVLVLAVGEATKLVPYLTAAEKAYETTIALGATTDTLDADGVVTERAPVAITEVAVRRAIDLERARTKQVPPAFSAIKVGGQRAHVKARRGEEVVLEARDVLVRNMELRALRETEIDLALEVSKGYFVRSLARDLAHALGTVGHLRALRRTRSGCFAVDEAGPLEHDRLIPLATAAARALPAIVLTEDAVREASFGRPVPLASCGEGPHAWLDATGRLVAVGETAPDGRGRVLRGFAKPSL